MRLLFAIALLEAVFAEDAWKAANVDRTIDATSQIVKVSTLYSFENVGNGPQSKVLIALSKEESATLSFISAGIDGSKGKLKISEKPAEKDLAVYEVDLRTPVAKGAKVTIRINLRITQVLEPLPSKIQQSDSQFVVLHTSAYVPSLYETVTQKTTIRTTQGGKLLSATTVSPSKQETERVIYGPYVNIPAFETKPVKVHYENNSPFVIATIVERFIEVSHWGNIAVEEYIELVHKGAELDGPFSRIDYQMDRRGRRQPALQQFTTVLPAQAKDIYYRDEIGNISTSAVRIRADSVDVEIRPRFPLFGGWKTSYVIGYNLPSEEYLYSKGNQYALKTKLFDHVFNDADLQEAKKTFIAARNQENSTLTDKIATLKTDSGASAAEKASELLKYDKTVFDAVDNYLKAVEKSTTKTAGTEEQQFLNKVKDARNRADSVLASI